MSKNKKTNQKKEVNPILEQIRKAQMQQRPNFNQIKGSSFKPMMPRGRRGDR